VGNELARLPGVTDRQFQDCGHKGERMVD
jgi:hypothetical protein